ncbi:hypothetical protein FQA39_LY01876 [Lamprigera yunnana]|nr:hypothetical protein FQA39_LY01876 [Lamprigera yunnana]
MVEQVKLFCVFSSKRSGTLKTFLDVILKKSKDILVIRNLSMSHVKVPAQPENFQKYHPQCYRLFSALPSKYQPYMESGTASTSSDKFLNSYFFDEHLHRKLYDFFYRVEEYRIPNNARGKQILGTPYEKRRSLWKPKSASDYL